MMRVRVGYSELAHRIAKFCPISLSSYGEIAVTDLSHLLRVPIHPSLFGFLVALLAP